MVIRPKHDLGDKVINSIKIVLALSLVLLFTLSLAPLATAQHNVCKGKGSLSYCQNVDKNAFCRADPETRYGRIIGVSWQHKGAYVGRYRRPLPRDSYCYIIKDKGKQFLLPVEKVVTD